MPAKTSLRTILLVAGLLAASLPVAFADEPSGQTLPLEQVLKSTLTHHPKIEALQAKIDKREAQEMEARGAFDWQLEYRQQSRASGYYDGWFAEQSLSRQLPFANSKIEMGYRNAEGTLPVYEEEYYTLDRGEPNVKLSMSLLRNRALDPKRQALQEAALGTQLEQQLQQLSLNQLLLDAANIYLDWYQNDQELQVALELLRLANQLKQGIVTRVANGDLARVVELEFRNTLLSRTAKVTELQQKVALSRLKLNLYQRDPQGNPGNISSATRPADLNTLATALTGALGRLDINLQQHPNVEALRLQQAQLETQRKLAKTNLLPELDVNVTLRRDLGDGSETLAGNESYVGLTLSAPIERRKAKGKLRAVDAELKALANEQRLMLDNLSNMMQQQQTQLRNQEVLLMLHTQQAELAKQLAKVEMQRFQAGDSDLFILNSREITSAQAQLRVAGTFTNILRQKIRVLAQNGLLSEFTQQHLVAAGF